MTGVPMLDGAAEPEASREELERGPVVVEARGLAKTFRIPDQRVDSLKERVLHPLTRVEYRELGALRDVSFDIHRGEFFGIVGRNGSGKSTLLKVLASIYRADRGSVRIAGRLAPFIELGVGFNPELTARENAVLNGVLMGLSKREARMRLDAVLDFAGLEDFVELKLKNYSSGMMVRLAFAVMVQSEADVMLIDEVLAVGDAAFAQKCMDVFHERHRAGKTIVLVTHDMGAVQSLCDRAMLLHDGRLVHIGDPEETAMRYYRLNFGAEGEERPRSVPEIDAVRVLHAGLADEGGARVENVEQGQPIVLDLLLEARRELAGPEFIVNVLREDGTVVLSIKREVAGLAGGAARPGDRMRISGRIENRLVPGRYTIDCWARRRDDHGGRGVQGLRLLDFLVYGTAPRFGIVAPETDVDAVVEPGAAP